VRSYDARDCREEGSEIGFPSHTAMSRSAPTEVLLAVLGAHQTDTLWCSNMSLRGVCQRTWLTVCICKRSACPPGPCLLRRGHPPCSRGGNATRLGHVKSADTPCARPQKVAGLRNIDRFDADILREALRSSEHERDADEETHDEDQQKLRWRISRDSIGSYHLFPHKCSSETKRPAGDGSGRRDRDQKGRQGGGRSRGRGDEGR